MKNCEWITPDVQTANEKFQRDDASHSNGNQKNLNGLR